MTGINEVAKEIHENARAHGWWDEERGFPEVLALIHSEVSEALEEYRNGHGATEIYFSDNGKPEGIPTELADVIFAFLIIADTQGSTLTRRSHRSTNTTKAARIDTAARSVNHGGAGEPPAALQRGRE